MNAPAKLETNSAVTGHEISVLTDIYQDQVNMAIWERELDGDVEDAVAALIQSQPGFRRSVMVSPSRVIEAMGVKFPIAFASDLAQVVDAFCCLFEISSVGLRIKVLESAMCPRFHVDRVPCRLVTTYAGPGSQWLRNDVVDRSKLGHGAMGLPDEQSGVYSQPSEISQLTSGDVALLKGELWTGNEGKGLVHRSPSLVKGAKRLVVTLDMA